MTPMGIHLIDGMVDLFGPVKSVYCQSVNCFVEADVDDTTSALLHFESGMTGYIGIVLATRPQLRFAVHGTDAIATIRERSYNFLDIVPFEGEAENIDYGDYKMDGDALAVERMYRRLAEERNERILPLVVNLADPSPGLGWRGAERKSLPARGGVDLTLALALIHHVVIGANIPLADFVDWLATLGSDLVIEFVSKADPMVEKLLRNKDDRYDDYDQAFLEACLERHFEIARKQTLESGTRTLYFGRRR